MSNFNSMTLRLRCAYTQDVKPGCRSDHHHLYHRMGSIGGVGTGMRVVIVP
jgi:hypothetical protein